MKVSAILNVRKDARTTKEGGSKATYKKTNAENKKLRKAARGNFNRSYGSFKRRKNSTTLSCRPGPLLTGSPALSLAVLAPQVMRHPSAWKHRPGIDARMRRNFIPKRVNFPIELSIALQPLFTILHSFIHGFWIPIFVSYFVSSDYFLMVL